MAALFPQGSCIAMHMIDTNTLLMSSRQSCVYHSCRSPQVCLLNSAKVFWWYCKLLLLTQETHFRNLTSPSADGAAASQKTKQRLWLEG